MIKYILILITFTTNPGGITLQHLAAYDTPHECNTFKELHNQLAESPDEVLACMKVKIH